MPDFWGSDLLPDSSFGGRWGPPYALLQGTFGGFEATNLSAAAADTNAEARPVLKRGDVAWAGGGGGNHFFVALAAHLRYMPFMAQPWAHVLQPRPSKEPHQFPPQLVDPVLPASMESVH